MRRLNSCGDTIVEVLLAIIVVGGVLAGAYVSSSKSLSANRASQERGEALKYVESQLEQLKADVATISSQTGYYCLDSGGAAVSFGSFTPSANLDSDNFGAGGYPAQCSPGSIPGGYHLSITQNSGTYTVRARWDRVGGGGREQITMLYKVSP